MGERSWSVQLKVGIGYLRLLNPQPMLSSIFAQEDKGYGMEENHHVNSLLQSRNYTWLRVELDTS
jgi:hypothetical protein